MSIIITSYSLIKRLELVFSLCITYTDLVGIVYSRERARLKKYAKYIVSMSLAFPLTTEAVTLGNITVKSYLNQPLDAYIRLIDLGDASLSGIKVRLASPEAFKRADIPRPYSLSKLSFKVIKHYGKPIVKVTSIERIDEPFMTFLLDLTWAKGQYYRTYTVLLDPPGYDLALERKPLPLLPPKPKLDTKSLHTIKQINQKPITSDYIKTPLPVNEEKLVTGTFGPVKAKDDLWKIAMRYRPDNISVYQVMIALLAFNEDAFTSSNINGLKTGVILEIPSYKVMALIPANKAKLEVEAQSRAWKKNETPVHVLNPEFLKRSFYEKKKKTSQNAKTSYLPPLQFNQIDHKKEGAVFKSTLQAPLTLPPTKTEEKKSVQVPLNSISSSPAQQKTKTNPGMAFVEKENKAKEQVFDSFIPIPQVLTKIVKHPKENASESSENDSLQMKKKDNIAPELAVAASAIATVKESNGLLRDQVKTLLKQNVLLKEEALNERKSVDDLKKKIEALTRMMTKHYEVNEKGEFVKRKSVKHTTFVEEESNPIYWILLSLLAIMILSAGGAYGLFYLARQGLLFNTKSEEDEDPILPTRVVQPKTAPIKPSPVVPESANIQAAKKSVSPTTNASVEVKEKEETSLESSDEEKADTSIDITAEEQTSLDDEDQDEMTFDYELSDEEEEIEALHEERDNSDSNQAEEKAEETPVNIEEQDPQSSIDENVNEKDDHVLDFEPGLAPTEERVSEETKQDTPVETSQDDEEGFVFESDTTLKLSQAEEKQNVPEDKPTVSEDERNTDTKEKDLPLSLEPIEEESKEPTLENASEEVKPQAPDNTRVKASTQLALAETYISMEDYDSAKSALEDVLETGNDKQIERAKTLLARIENKSG